MVSISADKEHSDAQFNLGNCYYYGFGVEKDFKEAVKWFQLSAEQGNSYAQILLALQCVTNHYNIFILGIENYLHDNSYKKQRIIGEGHFGEVWLLNNAKAFKVLKSKYIEKPNL